MRHLFNLWNLYNKPYCLFVCRWCSHGNQLDAEHWGPVTVGPHQNIVPGMAALFSCYYVFNLVYQEEASSTLEFIQRYVLEGVASGFFLLHFPLWITCNVIFIPLPACPLYCIAMSFSVSTCMDCTSAINAIFCFFLQFCIFRNMIISSPQLDGACCFCKQRISLSVFFSDFVISDASLGSIWRKLVTGCPEGNCGIVWGSLEWQRSMLERWWGVL